MAKYLYSTGYMYRRGGKLTHSYTFDEHEKFNEVSVQRALYMFIEEDLKPFYLHIKQDFTDFREDKLYDDSVKTVFTMNEQAIGQLYRHYGMMNQGQNGKPFDSQIVTVHEVLQLFKFDSPLALTRGMIRQAFSLCKMTIVNELDKKSTQTYMGVTQVEFLELIARVAELYFRDSEYEELMLSEKVEYILDDLLFLVECTRTKQKIVIEEFSDSDDDY